MAGAVKTKTTELESSRVRVDVEVAPAAVEREVESAARALGREMRVSGFRRGKVPAPVVIQRVGREAVLEEAIRRGLPGWYEEALAEARLATVGDPKLDVGDYPAKGDPLSFTIEVGVRPTAKLGEYKGLEVGRREPQVDAGDVERELERLRESLASLESVDREAREGDYVVLDFVGTLDGEPFEGGEARGYTIELGSDRLVPGFEEQLVGAKAGEERDVRVTFPDDYGVERLRGREAVFATTVKDVKEKRLPELDDDFATDAAGFDTLDELRADIEQKLREADERSIEGEFRQAVLDAAVEAAAVEVPHELVHAKAHEMWHDTAHQLQHRGIDPRRWLEVTGKDEEELVTESEPEAERALKRESVLAAVVEAEGIEVSDDDLLDALREAAVRQGGQPPSERSLRRSLERAKQQGRAEALREDIAMRRALDVLVESAKAIPVEQAKARDKLWTPGKEEREEGSPELWTPRS
ncbi:MAG: trigger factor [Thermoleophilaceae bacterium]|nr:trigger factor [Thermoleophilaceae bacterium]